ncbi:light-regulated protein 1, chloroplastic [Cicer arietinum]|uniref:Light-regulated protein 1, chloroplastic n=2 Tax=Cicer arietinum TaxID=3827 RepID=A0A1S2XQS4_CICAR|nr:light-regulated protein 1, chloroplastic [Cicer arietinum]
MQTALTFAPTTTFVPLTAPKSVSHLTTTSFPTKLIAPRYTAVKVATGNSDTPTVDYNSAFSVFPAEACETVGGEACLADMYPEVKLQPEAKNDTPKASENIEREYLDYNDPKTVFQAEACDDLGGTFCEPDYQKGVY